MQREQDKEEKKSDSFVVSVHFDNDPDIQKMREGYSKRFFQLFLKGYLNYEAGEWDVAREVFEQTSDMLREGDGPSSTLLAYMKEFNFDATSVPKGWPGYRELLDK